jgi:hypothetical protein
MVVDFNNVIRDVRKDTTRIAAIMVLNKNSRKKRL